jgi:hypothetical protein
MNRIEIAIVILQIPLILSNSWLDEFDAVAKWIAKLKPVIAFDGNGVGHFDALCFERATLRRHIIHLIRKVRLGLRAVDAGFRAHMHLHVADLQPEPAAMLK